MLPLNENNFQEPEEGSWAREEVEALIMEKTKDWSKEEQAQFLAHVRHETMNYQKYREMLNKDGTTVGNYDGGPRYRGSGLTMLTHKYNYFAFGEEVYGEGQGQKFVDNPEIVSSDLNVAMDAALWHWYHQVRPNTKDFSNTEEVTRALNGGLNGLDERTLYYNEYFKFLTEQVGEEEAEEIIEQQAHMDGVDFEVDKTEEPQGVVTTQEYDSEMPRWKVAYGFDGNPESVKDLEWGDNTKNKTHFWFEGHINNAVAENNIKAVESLKSLYQEKFGEAFSPRGAQLVEDTQQTRGQNLLDQPWYDGDFPSYVNSIYNRSQSGSLNKPHYLYNQAPIDNIVDELGRVYPSSIEAIVKSAVDAQVSSSKKAEQFRKEVLQTTSEDDFFNTLEEGDKESLLKGLADEYGTVSPEGKYMKDKMFIYQLGVLYKEAREIITGEEDSSHDIDDQGNFADEEFERWLNTPQGQSDVYQDVSYAWSILRKESKGVTSETVTGRQKEADAINVMGAKVGAGTYQEYSTPREIKETLHQLGAPHEHLFGRTQKEIDEMSYLDWRYWFQEIPQSAMAAYTERIAPALPFGLSTYHTERKRALSGWGAFVGEGIAYAAPVMWGDAIGREKGFSLGKRWLLGAIYSALQDVALSKRAEGNANNFINSWASDSWYMRNVGKHLMHREGDTALESGLKDAKEGLLIEGVVTSIPLVYGLIKGGVQALRGGAKNIKGNQGIRNYIEKLKENGIDVDKFTDEVFEKLDDFVEQGGIDGGAKMPEEVIEILEAANIKDVDINNKEIFPRELHNGINIASVFLKAGKLFDEAFQRIKASRETDGVDVRKGYKSFEKLLTLDKGLKLTSAIDSLKKSGVSDSELAYTGLLEIATDNPEATVKDAIDNFETTDYYTEYHYDNKSDDFRMEDIPEGGFLRVTPNSREVIHDDTSTVPSEAFADNASQFEIAIKMGEEIERRLGKLLRETDIQIDQRHVLQGLFADNTHFGDGTIAWLRGFVQTVRGKRIVNIFEVQLGDGIKDLQHYKVIPPIKGKQWSAKMLYEGVKFAHAIAKPGENIYIRVWDSDDIRNAQAKGDLTGLGNVRFSKLYTSILGKQIKNLAKRYGMTEEEFVVKSKWEVEDDMTDDELYPLLEEAIGHNKESVPATADIRNSSDVHQEFIEPIPLWNQPTLAPVPTAIQDLLNENFRAHRASLRSMALDRNTKLGDIELALLQSFEQLFVNSIPLRTSNGILLPGLAADSIKEMPTSSLIYDGDLTFWAGQSDVRLNPFYQAFRQSPSIVNKFYEKLLRKYNSSSTFPIQPAALKNYADTLDRIGFNPANGAQKEVGLAEAHNGNAGLNSYRVTVDYAQHPWQIHLEGRDGDLPTVQNGINFSSPRELTIDLTPEGSKDKVQLKVVESEPPQKIYIGYKYSNDGKLVEIKYLSEKDISQVEGMEVKQGRMGRDLNSRTKPIKAHAHQSKNHEIEETSSLRDDIISGKVTGDDFYIGSKKAYTDGEEGYYWRTVRANTIATKHKIQIVKNGEVIGENINTKLHNNSFVSREQEAQMTEAYQGDRAGSSSNLGVYLTDYVDSSDKAYSTDYGKAVGITQAEQRPFQLLNFALTSDKKGDSLRHHIDEQRLNEDMVVAHNVHPLLHDVFDLVNRLPEEKIIEKLVNADPEARIDYSRTGSHSLDYVLDTPLTSHRADIDGNPIKLEEQLVKKLGDKGLGERELMRLMSKSSLYDIPISNLNSLKYASPHFAHHLSQFSLHDLRAKIYLIDGVEMTSSKNFDDLGISRVSQEQVNRKADSPNNLNAVSAESFYGSKHRTTSMFEYLDAKDTNGNPLYFYTPIQMLEDAIYNLPMHRTGEVWKLIEDFMRDSNIELQGTDIRTPLSGTYKTTDKSNHKYLEDEYKGGNTYMYGGVGANPEEVKKFYDLIRKALGGTFSDSDLDKLLSMREFQQVVQSFGKSEASTGHATDEMDSMKELKEYAEQNNLLDADGNPLKSNSKQGLKDKIIEAEQNMNSALHDKNIKSTDELDKELLDMPDSERAKLNDYPSDEIMQEYARYPERSRVYVLVSDWVGNYLGSKNTSDKGKSKAMKAKSERIRKYLRLNHGIDVAEMKLDGEGSVEKFLNDKGISPNRTEDEVDYLRNLKQSIEDTTDSIYSAVGDNEELLEKIKNGDDLDELDKAVLTENINENLIKDIEKLEHQKSLLEKQLREYADKESSRKNFIEDNSDYIQELYDEINELKNVDVEPSLEGSPQDVIDSLQKEIEDLKQTAPQNDPELLDKIASLEEKVRSFKEQSLDMDDIFVALDEMRSGTDFVPVLKEISERVKEFNTEVFKSVNKFFLDLKAREKLEAETKKTDDGEGLTLVEVFDMENIEASKKALSELESKMNQHFEELKVLIDDPEKPSTLFRKILEVSETLKQSEIELKKLEEKLEDNEAYIKSLQNKNRSLNAKISAAEQNNDPELLAKLRKEKKSLQDRLRNVKKTSKKRQKEASELRPKLKYEKEQLDKTRDLLKNTEARLRWEYGERRGQEKENGLLRARYNKAIKHIKNLEKSWLSKAEKELLKGLKAFNAWIKDFEKYGTEKDMELIAGIKEAAQTGRQLTKAEAAFLKSGKMSATFAKLRQTPELGLDEQVMIDYINQLKEISNERRKIQKELLEKAGIDEEAAEKVIKSKTTELQRLSDELENLRQVDKDPVKKAAAEKRVAEIQEGMDAIKQDIAELNKALGETGVGILRNKRQRLKQLKADQERIKGLLAGRTDLFIWEHAELEGLEKQIDKLIEENSKLRKIFRGTPVGQLDAKRKKKTRLEKEQIKLKEEIDDAQGVKIEDEIAQIDKELKTLQETRDELGKDANTDLRVAVTRIKRRLDELKIKSESYDEATGKVDPVREASGNLYEAIEKYKNKKGGAAQTTAEKNEVVRAFYALQQLRAKGVDTQGAKMLNSIVIPGFESDELAKQSFARDTRNRVGYTADEIVSMFDEFADHGQKWNGKGTSEALISFINNHDILRDPSTTKPRNPLNKSDMLLGTKGFINSMYSSMRSIIISGLISGFSTLKLASLTGVIHHSARIIGREGLLRWMAQSKFARSNIFDVLRIENEIIARHGEVKKLESLPRRKWWQYLVGVNRPKRAFIGVDSRAEIDDPAIERNTPLTQFGEPVIGTDLTPAQTQAMLIPNKILRRIVTSFVGFIEASSREIMGGLIDENINKVGFRKTLMQTLISETLDRGKSRTHKEYLNQANAIVDVANMVTLGKIQPNDAKKTLKDMLMVTEAEADFLMGVLDKTANYQRRGSMTNRLPEKLHWLQKVSDVPVLNLLLLFGRTIGNQINMVMEMFPGLGIGYRKVRGLNRTGFDKATTFEMQVAGLGLLGLGAAVGIYTNVRFDKYGALVYEGDGLDRDEYEKHAQAIMNSAPESITLAMRGWGEYVKKAKAEGFYNESQHPEYDETNKEDRQKFFDNHISAAAIFKYTPDLKDDNIKPEDISKYELSLQVLGAPAAIMSIGTIAAQTAQGKVMGVTDREMQESGATQALMAVYNACIKTFGLNNVLNVTNSLASISQNPERASAVVELVLSNFISFNRGFFASDDGVFSAFGIQDDSRYNYKEHQDSFLGSVVARSYWKKNTDLGLIDSMGLPLTRTDRHILGFAETTSLLPALTQELWKLHISLEPPQEDRMPGFQGVDLYEFNNKDGQSFYRHLMNQMLYVGGGKHPVYGDMPYLDASLEYLANNERWLTNKKVIEDFRNIRHLDILKNIKHRKHFIAFQKSEAQIVEDVWGLRQHYLKVATLPYHSAEHVTDDKIKIMKSFKNKDGISIYDYLQQHRNVLQGAQQIRTDAVEAIQR